MSIASGLRFAARGVKSAAERLAEQSVERAGEQDHQPLMTTIMSRVMAGMSKASSAPPW